MISLKDQVKMGYHLYEKRFCLLQSHSKMQRVIKQLQVSSEHTGAYIGHSDP